MKNRYPFPFFATALSASLFLAACGQQSEPPATTQTSPSPAPAVADIRKAANSTVAEVQKQESAVTDVAKAASPPTPPAPETPAATTQVQNILVRVKTLVTEKRYPEALTALGELSNVTLTAEQQTLVDQLKAQVEKAMASDAANEGIKAVGGLLNQKK